MKPPTHIAKCIKFMNKCLGGRLLNCEIGCICGNQNFMLLYPGATHNFMGKIMPCTLQIDDIFFFLIKAKCLKCNLEYILFDSDFHGWDGFVCHDVDNASKPRPSLTPWKCLECKGQEHLVYVQFCYGDLDEIAKDLKEMQVENLADAFEWIYIDIKCNSCGYETKKWVDYETM